LKCSEKQPCNKNGLICNPFGYCVPSYLDLGKECVNDQDCSATTKCDLQDKICIPLSDSEINGPKVKQVSFRFNNYMNNLSSSSCTSTSKTWIWILLILFVLILVFLIMRQGKKGK
jgi:hypothetical protein